MTLSNTETEHDTAWTTPVFAARLTPHRSLGHAGFIAVMSAVVVLNVIGGIIFSAIGAWPVLPFLGLDVLIVWLAFRASYRQQKGYEEVVVTPGEVRVRRVRPSGEERNWRFNTAFARLARDRDPEAGTVEAIILSESGRSLLIGRDLPPVEREDFGEALARALADAKRGPTFNRFALE